MKNACKFSWLIILLVAKKFTCYSTGLSTKFGTFSR
jgi:hypothetical protein